MYDYRAKCTRVIDGDTIEALVDLGFDTWKQITIRFDGIDAWESRTRDDQEKIKGLAAKARLIELLEENDNEFLLQSKGVGKFGRCLGELYVGASTVKIEGQSINQVLREEGHAKEYDGGKR
tara:strand:+ start:319 stop:684 length:366 start_codon:yes stop_codon:yes gene_type:complete